MSPPASTTATTTQASSDTEDVKVPRTRTVTYEFRGAFGQGLKPADVKLPYFWKAIDPATNKVEITSTKSDFVRYSTVKVGKTNRTKIDKVGRIVIEDIPTKFLINLYLNNDAKLEYYQSPVYSVAPGENDVLVGVDELVGLLTDSASLTFVKQSEAKGRVCDEYSAKLTGKIWMEVTHKFTEAEADKCVSAAFAGVAKSTPDEIRDPIREAICSVYRGDLKSNDLVVKFPGTVAPRELELYIDSSKNPTANIPDFSQLADGLPRIHPKTLLAVLLAAHGTELTYVQSSSDWRPILGSILHRSGLSFDIVKIRKGADEVWINRQYLSGGEGDANDKYVTEAEKEYWTDYVSRLGELKSANTAKEKSDGELKSAEGKLTKAKKELDRATKKFTDQSVEVTKVKLALGEAQKARDEAADAVEAARTEEDRLNDLTKSARATWLAEMKAHEPKLMRTFRSMLANTGLLNNLYDPWFMDMNATDPNRQIDDNENLHEDHLHIGV